jgi:hypothetical protein
LAKLLRKNFHMTHSLIFCSEKFDSLDRETENSREKLEGTIYRLSQRVYGTVDLQQHTYVSTADRWKQIQDGDYSEM